MNTHSKIKRIIYSASEYILSIKRKQLKIYVDPSQNNVFKQWQDAGMPVPPPLRFKQLIIEEYANKFNINVFIETGTYLGETIEYCKNIFKKLISIELDGELFNNASIKFAHENKITIHQGDSGIVLQKVLVNISEPCLFWLDGHYSEGITAKGKLNTPILEELTHILNHPIQNHVILIDDARCFIGTDDYPTISDLRDLIKQSNSQLNLQVENDIIRIHKK